MGFNAVMLQYGKRRCKNLLEKRVNRKDFVMCICIFLVLFICTLLHDIPFFSYVSLTTFFVFMYMMLIRKPHFMITYFAFVFTSTGLIIGCAICEFSDAFMPEFLDWAHYAGSLPLLIILYVSFFMAIAFFDWIREKQPNNNTQQYTTIHNNTQQYTTIHNKKTKNIIPLSATI